MNERELIERLSGLMPRSPAQLGSVFECDAEVLPWGDEFLLFSTDEFSEEDLFLTDDARLLGRNIACAALSDLLAAGGEPLYYAHSLTADALFTPAYTEAFYGGIAEVLREAGVSFIGGDYGVAPHWRCCASVIGRTSRPVLRSGARCGDWLYLTGAVGAGNVQAAVRLLDIPLEGEPPGFVLRLDAMGDIACHATACIDTSDGLVAAARTLARMSGVGCALDEIPYLPLGRVVAERAGLPPEMLILCECGEYELLFAAADPALPYPRIGRITEAGLLLGGRDISGIELSARAFASHSDYLREVQRVCAALS